MIIMIIYIYIERERERERDVYTVMHTELVGDSATFIGIFQGPLLGAPSF